MMIYFLETSLVWNSWLFPHPFSLVLRVSVPFFFFFFWVFSYNRITVADISHKEQDVRFRAHQTRWNMERPTEQIRTVAPVWSCKWEVLCSNLGRGNRCSDWCFTWISSVLPDNYGGNTYLRGWDLLEELPIVQPLKNFPAFHGTRRFNTVFTRALHWFCFHVNFHRKP
jgi:hypothetical protein